MQISEKALTVVDEKGERKIESKTFYFYIGTGQPDKRSVSLTGNVPVEVKLEFA